MVRTLTLVAVRKQHNQRGTLAPLLLGGRHELVNDGLSAVCEVTELSLPHHERVGALHRVTVLEAENAVLREEGVVDTELALILREVLQRRPFLISDVVVQNSVTLNEGTALNILTAHTNVGALHQQRTEGEQFTHTPVHVAGAAHLNALLHELLQLLVDGEALRSLTERISNTLESLQRDSGLASVNDLGVLLSSRQFQTGNVRSSRSRCRRLSLDEDSVQLRVVGIQNLVCLLLRDIATTDQVLCVQGAGRGQDVNILVHLRLGHRRIVSLVVTAAAVANQVNDNVATEALTVLECQACGANYSIWIISVDVEDRSLGHTRNVGGVGCGAAVVRQGGEANLVVHHNVHGAAGGVRLQVSHLQGLHDDTLASERCVTVNQDRQDRVALNALLAVDVLLSADDTLEHGVCSLKVRGVSSHVHLGLLTGIGGEDTLGTEVVLHVTGATLVGCCGAGELTENLSVGLTSNVGQNVQATAVCHTNGNALQVVVSGLVQNSVQQRNQGLAALQGEALLTQVLGLQEVLECLSLNQLGENTELLLAGGLSNAALQALLEPCANLGVLRVHVLNGQGAGVCLVQALQDGAQRQTLGTAEATGRVDAVQIPQGQAVVLQLQVRVRTHLVTNGVGCCGQVAVHAVRVNQLLDTCNLGNLVSVIDVVVACPTNRLEGNLQVAEDCVVEVVAAEQVVLNQLQELTGTCTLNDAVVVSAGQGDDLGQALLGDELLGQATELSRVLQRAHTDDGCLALGEAGHRVDGTNTTGVGQRNSGAAEVLNGQRAVTATLNDVVVRIPELAEAQLLSTLEVRNDQVTGTIGAGQVNSQTKVHVCVVDCNGLALLVHTVGHVHRRHRCHCANHSVTNDVGEGDLAAAGACQVLVDGSTVLNEQLCGDRTNGGCGGDSQRLFHGRDNCLSRAAEGDNLVFNRFHRFSLLGSSGRGGVSRRSRRLRCRGGGSCYRCGRCSRCGGCRSRSCTSGTGASQRLIDGLKNGPP